MTKDDMNNLDWVKNAWIWSKNNRKLSLLNYSVEDVDIDEIAHALANTCRFGGHCKRYYSVAEHCVIMSEIMEEEFAHTGLMLAALLHDASEYMLTDVPKPFKGLMPEYEKYEDKIMSVIEEKFDVNCRSEVIKQVDKEMVISEAKALFDTPEWIETWPYQPIEDFESKYLACHEPDAAYFSFMSRFRELISCDSVF